MDSKQTIHFLRLLNLTVYLSIHLSTSPVSFGEAGSRGFVFPVLSSLLLSVYSYSGFIFFLFFLCFSHPSPFLSGLTSVSAAPSPAGFSGQESCVQTLWSATKPAMTACQETSPVGKQLIMILVWPTSCSHHLCYSKENGAWKTGSLMLLFEPE